MKAGDLLGQVHSLEQPGREPAQVLDHADGMLVANRGPSIHDVDPPANLVAPAPTDQPQ